MQASYKAGPGYEDTKGHAYQERLPHTHNDDASGLHGIGANGVGSDPRGVYVLVRTPEIRQQAIAENACWAGLRRQQTAGTPAA